MRTITKTVYQYSELDEETKEKARTEYMQNEEFFGGQDAINSLTECLSRFNCHLNDYQIDFLEPYRNSVSIDYAELPTKKEMLQAIKDCEEMKPTGYCSDYNFAQGVKREYRGGERDMRELMLAGMRAWECAVQDDAEHQYTDEYFADFAEANEYEFYANGELI